MQSIPLPAIGGTITIQLDGAVTDDPYTRERRSSPQEIATWSLTTLANTLTVEVAVRMLTVALMERQIVLISASKERRTAVAFCLRALLEAGGVKYRHTFLPLLPPDLYPIVEAPTPFIVGVPSWYEDQFYSKNLRFCIDNVGFLLKMLDFVLKRLDFAGQRCLPETRSRM